MSKTRTGRGGRRPRRRRAIAGRQRTNRDRFIPRTDRNWYGRVVGVSWVGLHNRDELFDVWTIHRPRNAWSRKRHEWEVTGFECRRSRSWGMVFHEGSADTRRMPDGRFQLGFTWPHRPHGLMLWVDRTVLVPALPYEDEAAAPIWRPRPAWKPAGRDELLARMNVLMVRRDPGDVLHRGIHSEGSPIECTICDDVFADNGNDSACTHLFWADGGLGWTGPGSIDWSQDMDDFRSALVAAGSRMAAGANESSTLERGMDGLAELLGMNGSMRIDVWPGRWAVHRLSDAMWSLFYDSVCEESESCARLARDAVLAMGDNTPEYDRQVISWLQEGACRPRTRA